MIPNIVFDDYAVVKSDVKYKAHLICFCSSILELKLHNQDKTELNLKIMRMLKVVPNIGCI